MNIAEVLGIVASVGLPVASLARTCVTSNSICVAVNAAHHSNSFLAPRAFRTEAVSLLEPITSMLVAHATAVFLVPLYLIWIR